MSVRQARERAGMSRAVLGGLVDRSAEWVKAVEIGRLPTPRLQMLAKLARALDVRDLADLTGNGEAVSISRFGRWEEAIDVANDGAAQLAPYLESAPADWHGLAGALRAENALTCARRGRHGAAWRHWESAFNTARELGPDYRHVQTSFGLPVMRANAVTLGVELRRTGEALRAADFDPADIASVPRRARHLIEVARAHAAQGDKRAVLRTLDRSERTAPETARFNRWARELAHSLLDSPPDGETAAVRSLAHRIGVH